MAAVLTIVNIYLLDGRVAPEPEPIGLRVDIALGELIEQSESVTQGNLVYAAFDLQEEDIEFCFDLKTVSPGEIFVQVNGKTIVVYEGTDNCFVIPEHQQRETNYVTVSAIGADANFSIERFELADANPIKNQLPILTRGGWDERAVRKVLKIFAFGGHATDQQINVWADMQAEVAIQEMLNFEKSNLLLSPFAQGETYTETANHGTLEEWIAWISHRDTDIPIPLFSPERTDFGFDGSDFGDGYSRMITVRGLNPFRQRIGFWETNYHLAVNRNVGVSSRQVARYYDLIMNAHAAGNLPYHQIMGVAAKSAAIAEQYGHVDNKWRYNVNLEKFVCKCNEDFAREIHQLFYGIFGLADPTQHEDVTIPETAKMLTDMPLDITGSLDYRVVVVFGTEKHHVDDVFILDNWVSGANAGEKIDALMPISANHPESLKNLPVMIISGLADDNLSESTKNKLRESWLTLKGSNNNFLEFVRTYAVSNLFHSQQQVKYFSSHERALYQANKYNNDNLEAFFGGDSYDGRAGRSVGAIIESDNAGDFFRPAHNVFGGQTGAEASDSSSVFENNYNALTAGEEDLRNAVQCESCDLGKPWEKKWATVLPKRADGNFYVEDIAAWFWNHIVGDMESYTELEQAHLYSLLGSTKVQPDPNSDEGHPNDFNFVMCIAADFQHQESVTNVPISELLNTGGSSWDDYCRKDDEGGEYQPHEIAALTATFTAEDIANSPEIQNVLTQLGQVQLKLEATGEDSEQLRKYALQTVNEALAFIFTTPFVFAEGRK